LTVTGYLAGRRNTTNAYLANLLEKPPPIEGPAGLAST
jgi:hypothetical protein